MENKTAIRENRGQKFVAFVIDRIGKDSAFRASLSRADNPDTEYQSWEYITNWCDDLKNEWELKPFAVIAAAISRTKPKADGNLGVGSAIAQCYEKGNKSDQAKAKLRRLLSCDSAKEACVTLRPLLNLISSRGVRLCYSRLLNDLLYFGEGEKAKIRWATDFYGRRGDDSLDS